MKLKTWAALQCYIENSKQLNYQELATKQGCAWSDIMCREVESIIKKCGDNPDEKIYISMSSRHEDVHLD